MNLRPVVRASAPIAVAASLALVLAACGSSAKTPTASKTTGAAVPCNTVTVSSTSLKVCGNYGATPKVTVSGLLKVTEAQRTVVITGTGAVPAASATINAHLSLFTSTGKKLIAQDAQVPLGGNVRPVFLTALTGVAYGSRTVLTAPASEVYGTSLPPGVKATDDLIIVSDVESAFAPVAWNTQVPSVTFDAKGKPTVKLTGTPMKEWAVKVLRQGSGAVVKSGDNVTVNYQGTSWNTLKIFDQSYGRAPATFNTTQVVTGFGGALVGQKVGTRLIVTMPPQYGYGTQAGGSSGLGGQTLVFVIEILKTAKGA